MFTAKDMMTLRALQIRFPLFFAPKIYVMTYPQSLSVSDEDEDFVFKDILYFFLEWSKYIIKKIIYGVSCTFIL